MVIMRLKKFNRYKFDFTAYALTFDFLSSEEKVSMAQGLAAVWKQHGPNPQESKTYDALRITADSVNSETYNSKMYAKGKKKKWYAEQNR